MGSTRCRLAALRLAAGLLLTVAGNAQAGGESTVRRLLVTHRAALEVLVRHGRPGHLGPDLTWEVSESVIGAYEDSGNGRWTARYGQARGEGSARSRAAVLAAEGLTEAEYVALLALRRETREPVLAVTTHDGHVHAVIFVCEEGRLPFLSRTYCSLVYREDEPPGLSVRPAGAWSRLDGHWYAYRVRAKGSVVVH